MKIVLIGNYAPDGQQSMIRFARCLESELNARGFEASMISPAARIAAGRMVKSGNAKWLAYVDKFVLFPRTLNRLARASSPETIFHICDHSNAGYVMAVADRPNLVTCHDLLAIRGARGDPNAYCRASALGKLLQEWIRWSLKRTASVACVSLATANDFKQLVPDYRGIIRVVSNGLNTPYRRIPIDEAWRRLANFPLQRNAPFILNVGSSLPRKNREGCLRIMHRLEERFPGCMVFVGKRLNSRQRAMAADLKVDSRIIEVEDVSNEQLEALYNVAHALLFPSFAEGFGWPVLEAQVCGCPVVCSNRTSIPEVAGEAALIHDPADEAGIVESLLRLFDHSTRDELREKGFANAARMTTQSMVDGYVDLYRQLLN